MGLGRSRTSGWRRNSSVRVRLNVRVRRRLRGASSVRVRVDVRGRGGASSVASRSCSQQVAAPSARVASSACSSGEGEG